MPYAVLDENLPFYDPLFLPVNDTIVSLLQYVLHDLKLTNLFHFITFSGCCTCCDAVSIVFHFLIVIGASISFCIVGLSQ